MKKLLYIITGLAFAFSIGACSMSEKNDGGDTDTDGQGGSLARFTVKGDYLYTVDISNLHTFNITDAQHPRKVDDEQLSFFTETVFPYGNNLLLGTDNGMFIYSLENPAAPAYKSYFEHIVSCDPVVAQNNFAYITLNSANTRCWNALNQLQIVDLTNLSSPFLVKEYTMISPMGLDIDNDTLYICDNGLTVYNVQNKMDMQLIKQFPEIEATDVICLENSIIVIGAGGLHQYKFEGNNLVKLSSILVNQ